MVKNAAHPRASRNQEDTFLRPRPSTDSLLASGKQPRPEAHPKMPGCLAPTWRLPAVAADRHKEWRKRTARLRPRGHRCVWGFWTDRAHRGTRPMLRALAVPRDTGQGTSRGQGTGCGCQPGILGSRGSCVGTRGAAGGKEEWGAPMASSVLTPVTRPAVKPASVHFPQF